MSHVMSSTDFHPRARELLHWYDAHARKLPWRTGPDARKAGKTPDPYHVWLSEIMLQQTTVPHAAPYFEKFLKLWPRIEDLADADINDITREWAGLGYYARARNLYKCAQAVAELGGFPRTPEGLKSLPGVGPYTAAAVGSIAFEHPVAPVDGNVERVISRLLAIAGEGDAVSWKKDKDIISERVQTLVPEGRAGDFAQAMMDLGATVCSPKSPACGACPWFDACLARKEGAPEAYPAKPKRKPQPVRTGHAFLLVAEGEVLLSRRPPEGLLGGMLMPYGTDWVQDNDFRAPDGGVYESLPEHEWEERGEVRHVFTHFALRLKVWRGETPEKPDGLGGEWVALKDVMEAGLPSVGKKALKIGLV